MMTFVTLSSGLDPLQSALVAHRAECAQEAADAARLQLLISSGRPWDRSTQLHATASALIVHPPTQRVLLRWHQRQQSWLQVGGHADPGERDPFEIAMREATEETGLRDLVAWPDRELRSCVHLVIVPVPAAHGEAAHEHADLRYVFSTAVPDAAAAENPSAPVRWYSLDEAARATDEANLRETLTRVGRLFGTGARP
jgi:8-oxo-dGTP pyrophosphatase MutT (NUDIX family)